jgi:hypothetical protein
MAADSLSPIDVSITRSLAVKMRSAGFCVHDAALKPLVLVMAGMR